jgi:hypothetical protein
MSTISSSLPAGLEALSKDGLLPSNLTSEQLRNASPAELAQLAINNVESTAVSSLFGAVSSSSDSVSLNENPASTLFGGASSSNSGTDPILQALETAVTNSSNIASANGTTTSASAAGPTGTGIDGIGTLFSYLG